MTPEQISSLNPFVVIGLLLLALNLVGILAAAAVLFVVKRALTDLRLLERAFNDFAKMLPMQYIRAEAFSEFKSDYRDDVKEIKSLLHEIFTKMDGKADKTRP